MKYKSIRIPKRTSHKRVGNSFEIRWNTQEGKIYKHKSDDA